MARGDLRDGEWELVEPFLPMAATGPIPDLRRQFDAVTWRFRVGSPWRDISEQYGNWSTIYGQFRSWACPSEKASWPQEAKTRWTALPE